MKSLLSGIGNYRETNKYYDDWSSTYDKTLLEWNYKAPENSIKILKSYLSIEPKKILDLGCGTGLFAEQIKKIYLNSLIDGADISKNILNQAKLKNIYNKLICYNFDKEFPLNNKYDLISCIGSLTYTKNPKKLFLNILSLTNKNGYFIFTHRVDLWDLQNFNKLLKDLSDNWKLICISRPLLYLPKNLDFSHKIKIKIALLKKI